MNNQLNRDNMVWCLLQGKQVWCLARAQRLEGCKNNAMLQAGTKHGEEETTGGVDDTCLSLIITYCSLQTSATLSSVSNVTKPKPKAAAVEKMKVEGRGQTRVSISYYQSLQATQTAIRSQIPIIINLLLHTELGN